ncbi:MAG TPA: hypothetical protein VJY33_02740 [Isosphaeraceae bacterium]|nr:hypothetical protein [Isosphaeraceae bacterium]
MSMFALRFSMAIWCRYGSRSLAMAWRAVGHRPIGFSYALIRAQTG